MAKILFITLFLLIFSLIPHSFAEIKTLKIISDNRPMILFEKFGFTHTGHVAVAVSSVFVSSNLSPPGPSRLGFFLLSEESLLQVLLEIQQNPSFCVLDFQYTSHLFTFRDLSPPPASSFNQSYPVSIPNEYSLFFANCNPGSSVSMIVRTEMYNLEFNGVKDYLPADQTQLPSLFFLFSLAYFVFLGYWVFACLKNKKSVHRIHLLMAGRLIIKASNLICAAEDKHYVKVTGSPHGWVRGLTRVRGIIF